MRQMKDSGIQWIGSMPSHWGCERGKFIFRYVQKPVRDDDGVITCFRDGEVTLRSKRREEGFTMADKEIGYQGIDVGDLVVHGMDGFAGAIGISDSRGKASPVLNVLDTKQCKKYFMYYLRSMAYSDVFVATATGIRVRSCDLRWNKLAEFRYPLPPVNEQYRIADFLDKKCAEIDSLTADVQKEIETLQEYRRSLITEAVTKGLDPDVEMKDSGNIYLGQINSQWETKRIKYLFSIRKDIAGYEGPTVLSITQRGIRPKNLAYGEGQQAADYSGYQLVSPGDFAMNHMDLLTGWVDISNQSGVTSPDYRVFRLRDEEQNNRRYFLYVMQMCYTNKIFYQLGHGVSGMGRWRLPTDRFLNFIVPVPSRIEQKRIATFLDEKCYEIDSIIDTKQKQLDTVAEYRKSLIYEYVTGKKEVV